MQAQNCTTLPAAWRHPDARTDSYSPEYYQHIARVLEAGKFDVGFFDDRLAMPDLFSGDHAHTVSNGIRCVKMDPMMCLMTMGAATTNLGLGATCSTTYYEPFHVARLFQTMDLMTKGRAAWNVVTSVNDNEALNMGRIEAMEHDRRYDRADEFYGGGTRALGRWTMTQSSRTKATTFMPIPTRCADSIMRRVPVFARPVHRAPFPARPSRRHPGRHERPRSAVCGTLGRTVVRGVSRLGKGKRQYAAMKQAAADVGQDPDGLKICSLFILLSPPHGRRLKDKKAAYDKLPNEMDQLSLLSEALNFDFASKGMDETFSDDELEGIAGMQSMRDRVRDALDRSPTVRDFMEITGRGLLREAWVGSPTDIADRIEEWFSAPACDGFVVAPTHQPGCFEDFVSSLCQSCKSAVFIERIIPVPPSETISVVAPGYRRLENQLGSIVSVGSLVRNYCRGTPPEHRENHATRTSSEN